MSEPRWLLFVILIVTGSIAGGVKGDESAAKSPHPSPAGKNVDGPIELDSFGGWKNHPASFGPKQPGRFFRVLMVDGRWWFITPEGNPFVSKGVTDVNWLGANLTTDAFHQILVDKYKTEVEWVRSSVGRLNDWGFNSVGPWSSPSVAARMSHAIVILDSAGHAPRPAGSIITDCWSKEFAEHAVQMAKERGGPYVDDPRLIGYFLDNELVWGSDHFLTKKSLLQLYAELPAESPGRQQALDWIRHHAGSIDEFNDTWGTQLSHWKELTEISPATYTREGSRPKRVIESFTLHVFDQYAKIAVQAIKRVDPNHLILGCRFHTYPGDALIRAAAKHFDVISMAYYEPAPPVGPLDQIAREVEKPFFIEEWTFKANDVKLPNVGIYAPRVRTLADRSRAYASYVETWMRRPYAVGFHWYKWMDNPIKRGEFFSGDNCGLLNGRDEPYQTFLDAVGPINRQVEHWHIEGQERRN